jgi:threonine/homoserine/homoserine lactone efflux protein
MTVTFIEVLLRGLMVGVAASITVGPVAVLCIQRTLSKSRRSGFMSGLGVACADTLLAIIAFFFYALLHSHIERYRHILSIVGGIFVVIVGVVIFLQKSSQKAKADGKVPNTPWRDFSSMFGFTIANFVTIIPYLLAFFAMFGVASHNGSTDIASISLSLLIIVGFFSGAVTWWFLLTLLISYFRRSFRPHHMRTINRVAGFIICLLGVITILSTVITTTPNGAIN